MIHSLRAPMVDYIQHTETFLAAATHNGVNSAVPSAMLPVCREMLRVFNDKWGDGTNICTYGEGPRRQPKGITKVQVLATALDPCTRSLDGVPSHEKETVWALVIREVAKLMMAEHTASVAAAAAAAAAAAGGAARGDEEGPSGGSAGEAAQAPLVRRRHAGLLAQMAAEEEEEGSNSMSCCGETDAATASGRFELMAMDELKAFQRIPRLSMQDHDSEWNDPLVWWRRQHLEFPNIPKLARCTLCVPATSAPSERHFSSAGLTVTQRRGRLTDYSVETLIFFRNAWPAVDAWRKRLARA
ncbi:unnamed protein product [Phaeothamnion confervicola]